MTHEHAQRNILYLLIKCLSSTMWCISWCGAVILCVLK